MVDISPTLIGKSQRLNADDLTEEGRIITVTEVRLSGDAEQPLAIGYQGDEGRPYYPCTTMRRVIAHLWGTDGAAFKGRKLHLYRDPTVTFGRDAVGGIRIRAVSHIERPVTCSMTISRGKRKQVTIQPIKAAPNSMRQENAVGDTGRQNMENWTQKTISRVSEAPTQASLDEIVGSQSVASARAKLRDAAPDLDEKITAAINEKWASFEGAPADDEMPAYMNEEMPA